MLLAGWHCLPQDLASIQELLRPLEERGVLVKRSEEQLLR
jgi:N-acetylglutamate synthase-like GNAT family acetyltransferase